MKSTVIFLSMSLLFSLPWGVMGEGTGADYALSVMPIDEQSAIFENTNYFTWGGSPVKGLDGKYHLFYSRWERKEGFSAWVTHSEIAHAVADQADGPYHFHDVALPVRGISFWDGMCTHNPNIHIFDGKYYLYYMGNTGKRGKSSGLNFQHRNNQRIGVAVADSPNGPWKRFDKPVIDVSPQKDAPDSLMTSNPSVTQMPDGNYLMVYKAVGKKKPLPFGGPVVHLTAIAKTPVGPFVKNMNPIFTSKDNTFFPAEDPYVWCEKGHFYALVKDNYGTFVKKKPHALVIFHSADGKNWELVKDPLVTVPRLAKKDGQEMRLMNLERPQFLFSKGEPVMLFCAGALSKRYGLSYFTFNIHIPIRKTQKKGN